MVGILTAQLPGIIYVVATLTLDKSLVLTLQFKTEVLPKTLFFYANNWSDL
jgi:hypothetical protein